MKLSVTCSSALTPTKQHQDNLAHTGAKNIDGSPHHGRPVFYCYNKYMDFKDNLTIIDGKSVFYRGYYAMGHLSLPDGTPTGGVYGFAAMLIEIIEKLEPEYIAVAWDKSKTNIRRRRAIYADYKANRKPAPPDFYAQIPYLMELLEAFNIPLYEFDDYEADDIIGTLARSAQSKGVRTEIISGDLDMSPHRNHFRRP